MDCRDALNALLDRLNESPEALASSAALDAHLAGCESCRREAKALEEVWERLDEDADPVPSAAFRARTLDAMEDALSPRRVRPFPSRASWKPLLQAAAVVLVAGGAFLAGRLGIRTAAPRGTDAAAPQKVAVAPELLVDTSHAVPDLSGKPRLQNVAYRPADTEGKIGVSFDVTTRYTVVGRPDQAAVSQLLAYLVTGAGETEGARGKAIDLVARHLGSSPASPQIVETLAATLKGDKNPGVRKKAAEALAQLPPTPAIRDALSLALKNDANPAVRMAAVEGLAKAAEALKDETTIRTLQEKASDEKENGYIRGQAALALNRVKL